MTAAPRPTRAVRAVQAHPEPPIGAVLRAGRQPPPFAAVRAGRQPPIPTVPAARVAVAALGLLLGGAAGAAAQEPAGARPASPSPSASGVAGGAGAPDPAVDPALFRDLEYRMIGPTRGGRVTAVAGHPAHPLTFYMGATGGGVWKTTDAGESWRNLSDGWFRSPSIGSIRVAPSDPDVVYVGTGSDGIRSNVIAGRGAYRSDDAGRTWSFLGLEDAGQIGAVEVDPRDPDLVYAAALGHPFGRNDRRGVFRSRDGGSTWEKVLFVSDSVGAVDLEVHPGDPATLYAALWRAERKPWTIISGAGPGSGDGIWKSTDGGDEWRRLERGLPSGLIGKADLAVTPADPDRVYALVEAPDGEEGLYRSDDRGESWRLVSDDRRLMNRPFYFTNITADPDDADVVYVGNVEFFRSTDGGRTWEERDTPHADNHDLWINPDDPRVMIQGNDGGANVSLDGGESWSTQYNQPTAELYQVDVDDRVPYWAYAGQQDSWTAVAVPSLPPTADRNGFESDDGWFEAVGGCETGPAVPKPGDPDTIFTNCKGRFGVYSRLTGQERQHWVGAEYLYGRNPAELEYRFQRVVPVEVSPHDPDVVYHGSQFVHRTSDAGATWETISPDLTANRPERQVVSGGPITRDVTGEEHYSTLYVIEESPLEQGLVWAGANDGPVHVTRDGGATWADVTPPGMPPEGRINAIEPSPHRPGKAYVAAYRTLVDDWRPWIWRTEDHGKSWTLLTDGSNGIPADHPARVVREDPEREGLLYAGTEFGMYVSFDDGARWQPLQLNLPVVPVTDLEVHRGDLVVSTMGRSFWVLHDLGPLRQAGPRVAESPVHLFRPRDAVRMRYRARPGDEEEAPVMPEYPAPGAVLDYWLGGEPDGPVTLEILDGEGRTVRAWPAAPQEATGSPPGGGRAEMAGGDPPPSEAPGDTARTGDPAEDRASDGRLPAGRGMHRFVWDLRHAGPWEAAGDVDGDAYGDADEGPLAAPGTYTARLSAGGRTVSRELRVRIDPRVAAAGITAADLEAQLALALRVRDAIGEARRTAVDAAALRTELEALAERPAGEGAEAGEALRRAGELLAAVRAAEAALVTDSGGSYPAPRLIDQLEYLYGMLTAADQAPGRDAVARLTALRERLDALRSDLRDAREGAAALGGGGPGAAGGRSGSGLDRLQDPVEPL